MKLKTRKKWDDKTKIKLWGLKLGRLTNDGAERKRMGAVYSQVSLDNGID